MQRVLLRLAPEQFFARYLAHQEAIDVRIKLAPPLDDPRWSAIVLFYLFYAGGVVVFPVAMGEERGFWLSAALYGALFGFMCYMAYDLTNLATIRAWSVPVAVVDMGWGAFLTALASLAGYAAAKRFDFL